MMKSYPNYVIAVQSEGVIFWFNESSPDSFSHFAFLSCSTYWFM